MSVSFAAVVLGSPNPPALAAFYRDLLGWDTVEESAEWVRLRDPARERPGLSVQLEPPQVPPAWPARAGAPQMQLHLDLLSEDLDADVARAVALGATLETEQPQADVRVLRDPDGHPFCLFLPGA
ncbi:VOC family protein [Pseudonocardia sp. WMMC193]|uniref:VOC family protein n=1 Tax=Pseudonocardia sp. WMMC193 TaxID=2911965 RepID=UPI001F17CF5A|nr:VOC family protein [Pseudonocardia sp. WMMC193]MCF7548297.1 VOC family protein [Pseudonocardia sp. WMMC193]